MEEFKRVFVSRGVVFDLCDEHSKWHETSTKALEGLIRLESDIFVSSDVPTHVYTYLLPKGPFVALEGVKHTITLFNLVPFSDSDLEESIRIFDSYFDNLLEALDYILAKKEGCSAIVFSGKSPALQGIKALSTQELCYLISP